MSENVIKQAASPLSGKAACSLFKCLPVPLVLLYPAPGLGAVVGCPGAAVGEGEFSGPAVYGEGLAILLGDGYFIAAYVGCFQVAEAQVVEHDFVICRGVVYYVIALFLAVVG